MSRKLVSEEELRGSLDAQLKKHEECTDCHFGGIKRARGTDDTGCNWSDPVLSCRGQPADICAPIARRVIDEARAKFNLE